MAGYDELFGPQQGQGSAPVAPSYDDLFAGQDKQNHPDAQAREKLNPFTRVLTGVGTGAVVGGGLGLFTGPGVVPMAIGGAVAGGVGEIASMVTEAGLEKAGVDPDTAHIAGRVVGAATGGGAGPAIARMGTKAVLAATGTGVVADLAAQGTEKALDVAEAPEPLKIGLPIAAGLIVGHKLGQKVMPGTGEKAVVPEEGVKVPTEMAPESQSPSPTTTPTATPTPVPSQVPAPVPSEPTPAPIEGSMRPIKFGDVVVGFKARVPDPETGVVQERYLTKDGKLATGIVASTDDFGNHLDFVDSKGTIVARSTAETPEAVVKMGQATRISQYQESESGRYASFAAKAPESDQPTMAFVTPENTYATTGLGYKPTKDSPVIVPESDPTVRILGFQDDPMGFMAQNVGSSHEPGKPLRIEGFGLPQMAEELQPVTGLATMDLGRTPMGTIGLFKPGQEIGTETAMRAFSPFTYFGKYFGSENPAIDATWQQIKSVFLRAEGAKWKSETYQGIDRSREVLNREWLPTFIEWRQATQEARGKMLEAGYEYRGATDTSVKAALKTQYDEAVKAYQEVSKPYVEKYYGIMNRLAADPANSDIRIPFLVEPDGRVKFSPTDHEGWIAQNTKDTLGNFKTQADAVGMRTLEGDYFPRPYIGRSFDIENPDLRAALEATKPKFSSDRYSGLNEADFHGRVEGVPNMWPSAHDGLDTYFRSTPRLMAQRGWTNKWSDTLKASDPQIQDYAQRFQDHLWAPERGDFLDQMVELMRSGMYLKGTGWSVMTAMKHLVGKLPLTIAQVGFTDTAKALPTTVQMMLGKDADISKVRNYFLNSKFMFDAIMDNPQVEGAMGDKATQLVDTFKRSTLQPTRTIEMFEHGLMLTGAIQKAAGMDFDYNQTMYAYLNAMARANFRGGVGHPLWMGESKLGKMGSVFTWTPQSIAETYGKIGANAGQDLLNVLTGKSRLQTELGENWLTVATRLITMYGAAEIMARNQGYSLASLIFHVPYTTGNAVAQMVTELGKGAWQESKAQDEPFAKTMALPVGATKGFVNYWGSNWAMWRQFKAMADHDYSDKYAGPGTAVMGIEEHR